MEQTYSEQIKSTTERLNSFGFWFVIFLTLVAMDQLTKLLAQSLNWKILYNQNFAFSLPVPVPVMYAIYFVALLLIFRYVVFVWKKSSGIIRLAWALILAGGLSNVGERIALGHVRDFIPITTGMLNFADFMIFIGAFLILLQSFRSRD
jgi:lipoprotein signal peptidase